VGDRLRLKCDGTRAETKFHLSAKRTSPFKSAGASVQSTTDSPSVRISGSNAGYIKFRGSVKGTIYLLHSPVFPSLPLPYVTVCHHISTGLYNGKIKGLPQQAEVAQGVPGSLRSRIFLTFRHYKGGRSSAKRTCRLYTRRNPWYSLSETDSTSGYMVL